MVRVVVVVMYIGVKPSLRWSRYRTRIPKTKKSLYVIAGPLQVPPTQFTDYLSTGYCPKGDVNDFDLRRSFYSKPVF